ncbi:MAG: DEAD/DEAH box helicase family protein [Leptospiraceae bacterium]|nr:DEAD/DEAH box helicase family protein [Leptospiraceae bacterium]MCP5496283.1 DEAD/DEAH box helicase family protein [Leptospiraceae bacterium]
MIPFEIAKNFNETETRAKLIDPALHKRGWKEENIKREETAPMVEIIQGKPSRKTKGRTDYTLRIKINDSSQAIALALIEAKAARFPPTQGLEQVKNYADSKRFHVYFVYSTNGYQFVEFNRFTGETSLPEPMSKFPSPEELKKKYEKHMGFSMEDEVAKPLHSPYKGGEAVRRYYQDAAIRAVFEKIAKSQKEGIPPRALLSLATGAGKTFIAVNLLYKISQAKQLNRALFICDRDELRQQGLRAFINLFGNDAAEVFRKSDGKNNAKNARIHIATYQTLGIEKEEDDSNNSSSFLYEFYPENYFSHIIIDECHRSAWGKWSEVLQRNSKAIQIGLTATPRQLIGNQVDDQITSNNFQYFGEPVYEYDISQGIEDGYLAACEIIKGRVDIDDTGMTIDQIFALKPKDFITGKFLTKDELKQIYQKKDYENIVMLPDRVNAMCQDLFDYLCEFGEPEQKTIIFCTRDIHCDLVAAEMNRLYVKYCQTYNREEKEHYAFKCTQKAPEGNLIASFRGNQKKYFIATTVDLLSTGVDIPCVRNIVFFRYLNSAITFYQMVGRGTRLDPETGKLMFRVYDYTNCTRLFGEEFFSRPKKEKEKDNPNPPPPPPIAITTEHLEVSVTQDGHLMLVSEEGKAKTVTIDDYKKRIEVALVETAGTLDSFRETWVIPEERKKLMESLPSFGQSAHVVQKLNLMEDYDLYDVLGEMGYQIHTYKRVERVEGFYDLHLNWLRGFTKSAQAVLEAILKQFSIEGTDGLENRYLFSVAEIKRAGGLIALKETGKKPFDILLETKQKLFMV